MSDAENENLEDLIGAPPVNLEFVPVVPSAPPTPIVLALNAQIRNPGEAPPAALSNKEALRAQLQAQIAALDAPAPEITVEQAKALTAWSEKIGWPALTPEELGYAASRGIETPQIIRNGRVVCRLMTPQRLRLLNIAAGIAPEPPPVMLASPVPVQRSGPTGRKIIIVEFDADYDGPLNRAEESFFETAAEAASMLDVSASALSQAVKKAAGQPFKVKGVTMQFLDLYIADDKNFSKND